MSSNSTPRIKAELNEVQKKTIKLGIESKGASRQHSSCDEGLVTSKGRSRLFVDGVVMRPSGVRTGASG